MQQQLMIQLGLASCQNWNKRSLTDWTDASQAQEFAELIDYPEQSDKSKAVFAALYLTLEIFIGFSHEQFL